MSHKDKSYCFVTPRFGEGIIGGAEGLIGALARALKNRGSAVQILTTCARDNRSWENDFPEGPAIVEGLSVRRFKVESRNLERWIPIQIAISQGIRPSLEDQLAWMTESVNSAKLYQTLAIEAARYDALFFGPYLFGTTFWGSQISPERSYLIPCLHDESYAYLDIIGSMFRRVAGCLFNARAEQQCALELYGDIRGGEVGMGFQPFSEEYLSNLKPYFADRTPYLLYLGRKETGKGVQHLIDDFVKMKKATPGRLKLVILGGGSYKDIKRDEAFLRDDIVDLESVSELDKQRIIRHAVAICQPSVNESFSIVLFEGWLLGTPSIVNGTCAVTREHVVESGGGLFTEDGDDFAGAVTMLINQPNIREQLAGAGLAYVNERYSWQRVLSRFDSVMSVIAEKVGQQSAQEAKSS